MKIKVALIGNPNVGKSLIFNNLTGGRSHIGNWPGKTVEKKEGRCIYNGVEMEIIDLPGVYSLTAQSIDELIARDYIIEEKPDIVIDIVDASNLERNLYLTLQLIELEVKLILVLNKMDIAENLGYNIDVEALSKKLGIPIVTTIATEGKGMDELKKIIAESIHREWKAKKISYGREIDELIFKFEKLIAVERQFSTKYPTRWLAIKILERDEDILKKIKKSRNLDEILKNIDESIKVLGDEPDVALAEKRYEWISSILPQVLKGIRPVTLSDMLDKVFLDKHLGIPIFLSLWWSLFRFTYDVSAPLSDLIDIFFNRLGDIVKEYISNEQLASFIADGILGGIGGVLVFLPSILFLFFGLSILEDSGYLARAAFVMDKLMYKLGLNGRSFIPILLGFGCNVPAIMATRTIKNEKDRVLTIVVNPLISCSARLPVYILIGGAVLGEYATAGVYSMYILGIVLAVSMALLFRRIIPFFKSGRTPFIMELPMYAKPILKTTVIHMWERGSLFLRKAGTIIFLGVISVWFLSTHPWGSPIEETYIAILGKILEPLFYPLGFDWRGAVALFFGFIAKEIVVGAFSIFFGFGGEGEEESLKQYIRTHKIFTPLTGYAFMAFTLTYIPCIATLGAIYRETGSWKWVLFTVTYELILAYTVAFTIVTAGHLLGFT